MPSPRSPLERALSALIRDAWTALGAEAEPSARAVATRLDELVPEVDALLADHLALSHRIVRAPWRREEVVALARALFREQAARAWTSPGPLEVDLAAIGRLVERATEPPAGTTEPAPVPSIHHELEALQPVLESAPPLSESGVAARRELLALVPRSALAMWRARKHVRPLLDDPLLRTSPGGELLWLSAAETFGMADADRPLAEAAADAWRERFERSLPAEPLAPVRTAWLLLRLDRFDDAEEVLARSEGLAARDPEAAAMHGALRAYLHAMAGRVGAAVATARQGADGPGVGVGTAFGLGVAARALVAEGRLDEAADLLAPLPPPSSPYDVGTTMQLLALAELALAAGEVVTALEHMNVVSDTLRFVGTDNSAGWHWVEPMARALAAVGDVPHARRFVEEARPAMERWGTPRVLAELDRALVAVGLPERAGPGAAARPDVLDGLSPRVEEVARLVAEGLRDREIAERLFISTRTVNRHVATALRRTGARNRTELAALVTRVGGV